MSLPTYGFEKPVRFYRLFLLLVDQLLRQQSAILDGFVAGAAAEVAVECTHDLILTRIRVLLKECIQGHDDAGRAETALDGA